MAIKKNIPHLFTLGNVFCGCIALVFCAENNLEYAAYWVIFGAVFDFFDGLAARLLHVPSELGKQLDSLADMVTFGVVPAFIAFQLIKINMVHGFPPMLSYAAFLIALLSAFRLAKFNLDTRQTSSFIGLPTPANALFWISIPLIALRNPDSFLIQLIQNPWIVLGLVILLSTLLVLEVPLFALKFKNLKWENNKIRFIFILFILPLAYFLNVEAIPIIVFLYFILSIIHNLFKKKDAI